MIKKRIGEIDILYTFGAILAVFGHSHPTGWAVFNGTFLYHAITFIYTFHMPLFFLITGVLLANSKSVETKDFLPFIKEKAFKLLTPYLVLSLIFIFPKGYLENGNLGFLNAKYLIKVIFSPRNNVWGHFWFLPVLFIFYLIFGALRKYVCKTENEKFTNKVLITLSVVAFFLILISRFTTDWFGLKDVFSFAFYIPFGMLMLPLFKKEIRVGATTLAVLALVLFSASIGIYILFYRFVFARFLISLLMVAFLFIVAKLIGKKGEGFFTYFGKNVFTIYIYSWPFQSIALMVLEKINLNWRLNVLLAFGVGIVCPILVSVLYNKLKIIHCKFFDLLLGMR